MKIIKSPKRMFSLASSLRLKSKSIGFVPTMGALHEGHLSLIQKARKENNVVVVSIFVNPTQFSKGEDFEKYPRDLRRDLALCRKYAVDIIFSPDIKSMYYDDHSTFINVDGLSEVLCGEFRPGHFKGVATIVAKLFNIVCPDISYFGQKDAQQAVIIKRMVRDLNFPVKIKVMPIVREKSGLAMSSRNKYLSSKERDLAKYLYGALNIGRRLVKRGNKDCQYIITQMANFLKARGIKSIDYISIVDLDSFRAVSRPKKKALIALAARIGRTRLIDNILI